MNRYLITPSCTLARLAVLLVWRIAGSGIALSRLLNRPVHAQVKRIRFTVENAWKAKTRAGTCEWKTALGGVAQLRRDRLDRLRLPEQEALGALSPETADGLELLLGFDPFHD